MLATKAVFGTDEVVADAMLMFFMNHSDGMYEGEIETFVTEVMANPKVKILDKCLTLDTVVSQLSSWWRRPGACRRYRLRMTNMGRNTFQFRPDMSYQGRHR